MSDDWYLLFAIVLVIGQAVGIGLILEEFIDPLLIWGGKECTAHGCFSSPPTGLILIYISLVLIELIMPSLFTGDLIGLGASAQD